MGYRCPVCSDPQADAVHLANHLAFTAMARGGDHEEWLDEHVPEWGQLDDEGLGKVVTEHAESAEFPQVFEDTTGGGHQHDHSHHGQPHQHGHEISTGREFDQLDAETQQIIEQARQLTQERRNKRTETDESETDSVE